MEDNMIQIKKDNQKAKKLFIVIMIVAAVLGGIGGAVASAVGTSGIMDAIHKAYMGFTIIAPYLAIGILIVSTIVTHMMYKQGRNMYAVWIDDDDEGMNLIEKKLSIALGISSVVMIIEYFLFPVAFVGLDEMDPYKIFTATGIGITLLALILTMVYVTIYQRKIIDFLREMNPEKQGSVYEMKFADKWEASCDEAEKLITYHSAYLAYKTTNYWCMGLWLFCVVGIYSFGFGIMPVAMVSIIWLVMTISYTRNAIKLS